MLSIKIISNTISRTLPVFHSICMMGNAAKFYFFFTSPLATESLN